MEVAMRTALVSALMVTMVATGPALAGGQQVPCRPSQSSPTVRSQGPVGNAGTTETSAGSVQSQAEILPPCGAAVRPPVRVPRRRSAPPVDRHTDVFIAVAALAILLHAH